MDIIQIDTDNRRQVNQFLHLPFRIYRDCLQWVPPLESDARRMLDRHHHPFYRHSDAAFFLASESGQTLGRIAVLDNRNYNSFNHECTAFFYLFECFADPRLIKVVMKDDQPVGFLFAYPDISAAIQRTRGRILPLGWLDLLLELRHTKWVNINGAGIIEQYRGLGGTALLFSEMYKSVLEGGFEHADIVQVGMENDKMQRELRDLGIDFYKTHRMYQCVL
jgi:hypothetical protein